MAQPNFDHERLDVYRLSIESVAFSYQTVKGLTGIHRPAGDQWLRAFQSIPRNIAEGKAVLKRIVSMLTRLIQRHQAVAENEIEYEYEYEYRDADGVRVRAPSQSLANHRMQWNRKSRAVLLASQLTAQRLSTVDAATSRCPS